MDENSNAGNDNSDEKKRLDDLEYAEDGAE